MTSPLRELAGVLIKDLPRYLPALASRGNAYIGLCNRNERIEWSPDRSGVRCLWRWGTDLHAPRHLRWLGLRLARRAHADHPVHCYSSSASTDQAPTVSFIVGHRGESRLPHLLATLASIAGQRDVAFECLVVEQDVVARLPGHLPGWVRHVHAPPPSPDMPYARSWAFNVGVKQARGEILVLHDNDIVVPADYAARIVDRVRRGHDAVNLKRFLFYLDRQHTENYFAGRSGLLDHAAEAITQNLEGGGSVAITREGFDRIGGMDESFIGWGGEDNEFWERAQTLRVWRYADLPSWHLWHGPQPDKGSRTPVEKYAALAQLDPRERIATLVAQGNGELSGPFGRRGAERA